MLFEPAACCCIEVVAKEKTGKDATVFTLPEFISPQSEMQAREIQSALRQRVRISDDFSALNLIAGVDVGYDIKRNPAHASIVTMTPENLKPIEQVEAFASSDFPLYPRSSGLPRNPGDP